MLFKVYFCHCSVVIFYNLKEAIILEGGIYDSVDGFKILCVNNVDLSLTSVCQHKTEKGIVILLYQSGA